MCSSDLKDVPVPDLEVREQELKLALQLIDQIAHETFDPAKYHDEVHDRIQELGLSSESEGEDPDRFVVVYPS